MIVDAHLDLAYNALRGRPIERGAAEQQPDDEGIPTVGLPDLRKGNVGLICATLFCEPANDRGTGYTTPQQAADMARAQLACYEQLQRTGQMRLVTTAGSLPTAADENHALPAIVLMEGADPIITPDDAPAWFDAGVRIVGLAWRQTRYAGGTGAPGGLTPLGRQLVPVLDRLGTIHDASHLAEQSFWDLLDLSGGPIMATHSNCRSIVSTDRQLSDDMIRAIVQRGGVIGMNFFDRFLIRTGTPTRRATLDDVVAHIRHICDLAGSSSHVGIGTDMDGGLGRNEIPVEIATSSDLPRIADCLARHGFGDEDIRNIMSDNWLRYFRAHLPGSGLSNS